MDVTITHWLVATFMLTVPFGFVAFRDPKGRWYDELLNLSPAFFLILVVGFAFPNVATLGPYVFSVVTYYLLGLSAGILTREAARHARLVTQ